MINPVNYIFPLPVTQKKYDPIFHKRDVLKEILSIPNGGSLKLLSTPLNSENSNSLKGWTFSPLTKPLGLKKICSVVEKKSSDAENKRLRKFLVNKKLGFISLR